MYCPPKPIAPTTTAEAAKSRDDARKELRAALMALEGLVPKFEDAVTAVAHAKSTLFTTGISRYGCRADSEVEFATTLAFKDADASLKLLDGSIQSLKDILSE